MKQEEIVDGYLKTEGRCYGHCDGRTQLVFLEKGERLISCMACPGGYVSRIVMYGRELDTAGFMHYLAEKTEGTGEVEAADIRTATRHPWDLGTGGDGANDVVIREAYWTQNYRRSKSENPGRNALFLCGDCNELYVSQLSGGRGHSHTR